VSLHRTNKDSVLVNLKWRSDFTDRHKFAEEAGCDPDAVELGFAEMDEQGNTLDVYQEQMDKSQTPITYVIAELCKEKKKVNPKDVKPWTMPIKSEFDVKLTKDEINAAACEAADLDRKIEEKKEALKAEAQFIKDEIKKMEGHKRRLVTCANTGRETKRVDCTKHFDPASRTTWLEYRGEVQERRAMDITELKELQSRGGLFGDGIGGDPEKVVDRLNGDELAKRVAEDAAIATRIKENDASEKQADETGKVMRQAMKDAKASGGVAVVSTKGDGKATNVTQIKAGATAQV